MLVTSGNWDSRLFWFASVTEKDVLACDRPSGGHVKDPVAWSLSHRNWQCLLALEARCRKGRKPRKIEWAMRVEAHKGGRFRLRLPYPVRICQRHWTGCHSLFWIQRFPTESMVMCPLMTNSSERSVVCDYGYIKRKWVTRRKRRCPRVAHDQKQ